MDIYTKRRRARRLNDPDREAIVKWSNDEDDGPDPEDLELDYSGVVDGGEEEAQEQREKMKKSVEGTNELDLDFEGLPRESSDPPDLELDYSKCFEDDEEHEREKDAAAIAEAVGEELAARGLAGDAPDADGDEDDDVHKSTEDEDDADDGPDPEDLELDYSGVVEKATTAAYRGVESDADEDADSDADGDDDEDANTDSGGGAVEKAGKRTADLLADMQDDIRDLKRLRAVRNVAKAYVADGGDPHDNMAEVFKWLDDHREEDITVEDDGSMTVEEPA